jgi:hypothetical protein
MIQDITRYISARIVWQHRVTCHYPIPDVPQLRLRPRKKIEWGKSDIRRSPGRPFFVSASVVSSFPKPFAMCSAAEQVSAGRVWFVGHGNGEICHNLCDLPGLV